jgi:putative Mn2+ efflux pump MntP
VSDPDGHGVIALLVVAASVGIGNFGAAAAIGVAGVDRRTRISVALAFALFEGGMPAVGIAIGRSTSDALGTAASLIGGLALCAAGLYGILGTRQPTNPGAPASPGVWRLTVLAALLSIDNLVVGFGLGAYRVSLVAAVVVLGSVSAVLGLLGLELGRRLGARADRWSTTVGGVVLIGVGIAIAAGA